jgi:hypothetical protein
MGEWIGADYFGGEFECVVCRKTFVKQSRAYYGNVECTCSWCGHKWTEKGVAIDGHTEPTTYDNRYYY